MRSIMQPIMRPAMLGLFRVFRFSRDRAPSPPPVDPNIDNPHMLYVEEDDGLAAATINFQSATGNIGVRVFGRNNDSSDIGLTAKVLQDSEGVETDLVKMGEVVLDTEDSSFCYMFAGKILPGADATLSFATIGSAGRSWIRVGDFGELPDDFADNALSWSNLSGDGSVNNYYAEIQPDVGEGYLMLSTVGWLTSAAAPITSTGDGMQFTEGDGVDEEGASVYYGVIDSPGGEPGWGGYVWYADVGVLARNPNALLVAIQGATLP